MPVLKGNCRNIFLSVMMASLFLSSCVATTRPQYDQVQSTLAEIPGFPNVRSYLDQDTKSLEDAFDLQPAAAQRNYLMISGGGAAGAFSAGVLSAWTKKGSRPEFDVVSGVSTGALIAPFAYLGSSYDDLLKDLYTSGVAKSLVDRRLFPNKMLSESLLRGEVLRNMIRRYVTADILQQVAKEHMKGRRLFVLTSNLDSQRAVIWNMGAIAASHQPGALQLFQDVLIASASIPGVYPAVLIKVHANGHDFQELHSDGGSSSQILTLPYAVLASANHPPRQKRDQFNLYVIVNNALIPEFSNTNGSTLNVMARAYSTLVKAQERDSLMALYGYTRRTEANLHVASIDCQLPYDMTDPFNEPYMRSVFDLGTREMLSDALWKDEPLFTVAASPHAGRCSQ
ncbi:MULTISPECIES: patatin-like phospholipase family protein [Rhizobium]|uniref:Putative acylesterase/phospholipase RssA n=1 Tax=Rhizobium paranaense TaxID=1650438 RepID=A0A7W8XPX3_9HYPH|nr:MULTISPECIES: patatin-like phospholipase family protein [Rhizobium]MBB5573195.1 putative acylesterase/phospholipase RssA [Rhizobium paranaense]